MPAREPLPSSLTGAPFSVRTALDLGVTLDRLRARDLTTPFHGVRSVGAPPLELEQRCRAYAARMPSDHVFSHETAAALWGMPLPSYRSVDIHVSAPTGRRAPEAGGTVGHQVRVAEDEIRMLNGLRVVSPALAWSQLAGRIDADDLVACADFVITGHPVLRIAPLATADGLRAVTASRARSRGHRDRVYALVMLRFGSWSRTETLTRLLVVRCGIPEPRLNFEFEGRFIDLAWESYRVGFEYEGDDHRDKDRFRNDISRMEGIIDRDWSMSRISALELFDQPPVLVSRVASRLAARGWSGSIDLRNSGHFRR